MELWRTERHWAGPRHRWIQPGLKHHLLPVQPPHYPPLGGQEGCRLWGRQWSRGWLCSLLTTSAQEGRPLVLHFSFPLPLWCQYHY